ncbi:hypothetical protein [Corynebacterium silvaticum]|uniref:Uncharacterized protein n=1 Tax=Corynebacterium silvaticum TaxID=2320431 RepID=A0A7Y4LH78_9CORY|nr:hypothetical protein [Corynebacterium silvaticum]ARU46722.1 hypothetical protein CBE74_09975 [Corynebacterium silvaticum]MBH5300899.1 hypothetical protein [Corynebacterium silvaticum]NOM65097.1 hypothetical protein [Corynebacterium silvaticum]NON70024.1 hypothetical protein [Corynebacterium silvaticum]TFA91656.1 hypothetical protein EU802_10155 [Corynebacterium silvaticum]
MLPDIPGVSRSTRDPIVGITRAGVPIARVEPGEFIVNREATSRNLPLLRAINGGNLSPRVGDLGLPRFADGGLVSASELLRFFKGENIRGQQGPSSLEGSRYAWGGGLASSWGDYSGTQSAGAALVAGVPVAGRKFATLNQGQWTAVHGFRRGMGGPNTYSIGFLTAGLMVGTRRGLSLLVMGKRSISKWVVAVAMARLVGLRRPLIILNTPIFGIVLLLAPRWLRVCSPHRQVGLQNN